MSTEITVPEFRRQISDVTRDIRIKTGQFLLDAIEIGRLLFEAKSMVEPGSWSKYIEEELPFSHSWANNYMRLYKELGGEQISLFDNSQALANLRPTQALELLALPAEEREEFVETHDVESMSTRQLRQAVQAELEEERRRHADTQRELESAQAKARDAEQNVLDMQQRLAAAKSSEGAWQKELDKLNAALDSANAVADDVRKQLDDAKAREKAVRADLKKAKENPDIPESLMEQMRKEAEADAARKATADLQKKLDAAEKAAGDAAKDKEAAEAAARDAQAKLVAAQKATKIANPDVMSINILGQQMLTIWNTIKGHRMKAVAADPGNAEPIHKFLTAVITKMVDDMEAE